MWCRSRAKCCLRVFFFCCYSHFLYCFFFFVVADLARTLLARPSYWTLFFLVFSFPFGSFVVYDDILERVFFFFCFLPSCFGGVWSLIALFRCETEVLSFAGEREKQEKPVVLSQPSFFFFSFFCLFSLLLFRWCIFVGVFCSESHMKLKKKKKIYIGFAFRFFFPLFFRITCCRLETLLCPNSSLSAVAIVSTSFDERRMQKELY